MEDTGWMATMVRVSREHLLGYSTDDDVIDEPRYVYDCPEHGCRCERQATRSVCYCETHFCGKPQCSEPRIHSFRYCAVHKCAVSDYPSEPSGHGHHHGLSPFCEKHTCGTASCRGLVMGDSRYCAEHLNNPRGHQSGVEYHGPCCKEHGHSTRVRWGGRPRFAGCGRPSRSSSVGSFALGFVPDESDY